MVFEPKEGCPICRLRDILEDRVLTFILGDAMMEPDVRIKTNELGFCRDHFGQMLTRRNRLALALMLDSHLGQIEQQIFGEGKPSFLRPGDGQRLYKAARLRETCFVCEQVDQGMARMLDTILRLYENERDFRQLFDAQPTLCLPHYALLLEGWQKKGYKKFKKQFADSCASIAGAAVKELHKDVRHFCDMFDYRNNVEGADWGNSKDSIERSVWWLTSRGVK